MSKPAKGPYLYLDQTRSQWVIRDKAVFIRTGISAEDVDAADAALTAYKQANGFLPEEPRTFGAGVIYFVTAQRADYPIKIGFTERLGNLRIKSLQTACPYNLYFLGHISGTIWQERHIHEKFDHLRLEGEWFRQTPELLSYIEKVCAVGDVFIDLSRTAAESDGRPQSVIE